MVHLYIFKFLLFQKWFAPEVHKQMKSKQRIGTAKMDIWNMGNIFYLMLTGRPPFDGLDRFAVHDLILKNHSNPKIPEDLLASPDPVHQTMIKAIKMCLNRVSKQRPEARYIANFLKSSMNFDSDEERDGRSTRFPSVEERVKVYMSHWYVPPCDSDPDVTLSYQMISKQDSPGNNVLLSERDSRARTRHVTEVGSKIVSDRVVMIEPAKLVNDPEPDFHQGYQNDVVETVYPLMDSLKDTPLLMQWGDTNAYGLPQNPSHILPHFKKCRKSLAKDELAQMTKESCYGSSIPRPPLKKEQKGSIIWKLDSNRLQGQVQFVAENDKPWNDKQPKGVFSGKLTGHVMDANGKLISRRHWDNMTDYEFCIGMERCRFVLRNRNSPLVDAQLTDLLGKLANGTVSGVNLMGPKAGMQEQLDYKAIIMLEGNDVASGLQWALRSNSAVMMPPPKFCSWSMEELLEPWVHYIPLDPSFKDTEEKMQWVLDHDEEARMIAHRGSLWIKDLHHHPDSEQENTEVNRLILERYQRLFVREETISL